MSPLLSLHVSADYKGRPKVLDEVALQVGRGEVVGLAGESGSGKSTLSLAILRLLSYRGGECRGLILFEGRDLLRLGEREMRSVRGRRIGYVPQSPLASLNPSLSIAAHFRESWKAHSPGDDWKTLAPRLLEQVCLPPTDEFLKLRSRELSVGLAQRVLVALAILHDPPLLIADEPTSALDVIHQAEIVSLLSGLSRERGIAVLHVSHDLPALASSCHRVAVLRRGRIVEEGLASQVFGAPREDYTRKLVNALPRFAFAVAEQPVETVG